MEISVGLYTIIFILFFLVIPGFLARRFYYHGEFSKQVNISINSLIALVSSFFIGVILTFSFIAIHNSFSSNHINIDNFLDQIDSKFVKENQIEQTTTVTTNTASHVNKFKGLTNEIFSKYLPYLGFFYAFSIIVGYFLSKIVLFSGADTRFKILRFRNEWHYLFSGKILKFKNIRSSSKREKKEVKYTYVDVLVAEKGDETTLYSGLLGDYEIHPTNHCKLEKVHLLRAIRYKKVKNTDEGIETTQIIERNIPGRIFTILGDRILNINCTYEFYDEDEQKVRKYNRKSNILFLLQLLSSLTFLSFLISFIFSINFFSYDWFGNLLKQSIWFKIFFLLTLNIGLGMLTPFTSKQKEKIIEFEGIWPLLLKLALVGLFTFLICKFLYH